MEKMYLVFPNVKDIPTEAFLKKKSHVKTMKKYYLSREYKILMYCNFLWHFPYTPNQLLRKIFKEEILYLALTVFNNIIKSILTIPVVIYSRFLFVFTSLMLTFSVFLLFSLAVSWSLFLKRLHILQAMKMMIAVSCEVSPRKFKSKWNTYLFLLLGIIGFMVFSISCAFVTLNITYPMMNTTSSYFFWYQVPAENERTFSAGLIGVAASIFTLSALTCSVAMLLSTTMYFHLGDVISNFGQEFKKILETEQINQSSALLILSGFEKILSLNRAVNEALSQTVSLTYGAMLSLFFTGICSIRSFGFVMTEIIVLDVVMFSFSVYCFVTVTVTGDRVQRKHEELKGNLISCLNIILNRNEKYKEVEWFSLLSTEIKSYDLHVTGGNMFVLSNSLILNVAGSLITYGVIIFNMD